MRTTLLSFNGIHIPAQKPEENNSQSVSITTLSAKSPIFRSIHLLLFCCLLLLGASSSFAQTLCSPCMARIAPGTVSAPIQLSGWMFAAAQGDPAEVLTPPKYGTWQSGHYIPNPDFWAIGADSITFRSTNLLLSPKNQRTLLITPLDAYTHHSGSLNFRNPTSPEHSLWQTHGDPQHVVVVQDDEIPSESELQIFLEDGEDVYIEDSSLGTGDPNEVAGIIEIGVSNPPVGTLDAFQSSIFDLDGLVSIDVIRLPGSHTFEARASFSSERFDCRLQCSTQAVLLGAGLYNFIISAGQRVDGPPGEEDWSLQLLVETSSSGGAPVVLHEEEIWSPKAAHAWNPETSPVDHRTRFGWSNTVGPGHAVLTMKLLERSSTYFSPFQAPLELSNFDTVYSPNTAPALLPFGHVDTDSDSLFNEHGVIDLLNIVPASQPENTPTRVGAEPRASWTTESPSQSSQVMAQLTIDSSAATVPIGTTIAVLELGTANGTTGPIAANLVLKTNHLGQRMVGMQVLSSRGVATSNYLLAGADPIDIAFVWRRSSANQAGGGDLWVNGNHTSLTNINNGHLFVDRITMGVNTLRYIHVPSHTSKEITFDNLLIRYQ